MRGLDYVAWALRSALDDFPEAQYTDILDKESIGIAFSGGGARSYGASIGCKCLYCHNDFCMILWC